MDGGIRSTQSSGNRHSVSSESNVIHQTEDTLSQIPASIAGGRGIQQQVDTLQKDFKSLSPHMKKVMYEQLTGPMKEKLNNLPASTQETLLKILNPKHKPAEPLPPPKSERDLQMHLQQTQKEMNVIFSLAEIGQRLILDKQLPSNDKPEKK